MTEMLLGLRNKILNVFLFTPSPSPPLLLDTSIRIETLMEIILLPLSAGYFTSLGCTFSSPPGLGIGLGTWNSFHSVKAAGTKNSPWSNNGVLNQ
jgi:hypothetical protein